MKKGENLYLTSPAMRHPQITKPVVRLVLDFQGVLMSWEKGRDIIGGWHLIASTYVFTNGYIR